MASRARPPAARSAARARARETPAISSTSPTARARSFRDRGWRSIIRFPYTFPSRTMLAVVRMLRTSLVVVPAFNRVDPASTSGPGHGAMTTSARSRERPAWQATSTLRAPRPRAATSPASTNGVRPLAEMPTTTSPRRTRERTARRAARASSSAPSRERNTAARPPAMMAWTRRGGVPKVGGHSAASSTPRRPLVPAPTKNSRPPPRSASTIRSTARAMAGVGAAHGLYRKSILAVHEPRDLERAQPVEVAGRAIRALGGQSLVAGVAGRRPGHEVRF